VVPLAHHWQGGQRQPGRRQRHDAHGGVVVAVPGVLNRADLDDAGVVHNDVQAAVVTQCRVDQQLRCRVIGDVAPNGGHLRAVPPQEPRRTVELILVPGADDQPARVPGEFSRELKAEPA
jgi:hypothetical protein